MFKLGIKMQTRDKREWWFANQLVSDWIIARFDLACTNYSQTYSAPYFLFNFLFLLAEYCRSSTCFSKSYWQELCRACIDKGVSYKTQHHKPTPWQQPMKPNKHRQRRINLRGWGVFVLGRGRRFVGATTPDTHGKPHGLHPQGWPSPQDEALRSTALLGASHKTPRRYPEDTTRSVRICIIPRFL